MPIIIQLYKSSSGNIALFNIHYLENRVAVEVRWQRLSSAQDNAEFGAFLESQLDGTTACAASSLTVPDDVERRRVMEEFLATGRLPAPRKPS